jgi:PAS domain S-box-containing protein
VPDRTVTMSTKPPANTEANRDGTSFASVLGDALVCGVMLIDGRERISHVSEEARRMLGLHGKAADAVSPGDLPPAFQQLVREALVSAKPVSGREVELKGQRGGSTTLRISLSPWPSDAARPGVAVVLNDLTTAKRLEQNLWHVDRLASLGTLSASMAHEIKNALVAGKTFVDLLLEKHQDAELVDVVRREMGRIDGIVSRMLKFVGPSRPAFAEVGLHEVLDRSLRLVQPQLEGRLVTLNCSFEAAPDRIRGDERQLQQAFVNLFLNALEAMGENGALTVATESITQGDGSAGQEEVTGQARLRIIIQDTGTGIAPEHLARLFDPFFTTKPSGTGLGLAITKSIIQEHHGEVSVESHPGKGTTFRITFSAVTAAA